MEKNNIMLMAVATAVIAVVLLGSWAYLGNDDDSDFRDPAVGDLKELESTENGVTSTMTYRIIAECDEGFIVQCTSYDGTVSYLMSEDSSIIGPMMPNMYPMEKIGDETIDTPFGEKDCEVWYHEMPMDGGKVSECRTWNSGGATYKAEITSPDGVVNTTILKSSTIIGDAPGDADDYAVRTTFQAGDEIWYNSTHAYGDLGGGSEKSSYIIKSVDAATSELVADVRYGEYVQNDARLTDAELRNVVFKDDANDPEETRIYSYLGGLVDGFVSNETVSFGENLTADVTVWTDYSGLVHALYAKVYDAEGQLMGTSIIALSQCTLVETF